jgi:hypothetical protein
MIVGPTYQISRIVFLKDRKLMELRRFMLDCTVSCFLFNIDFCVHILDKHWRT